MNIAETDKLVAQRIREQRELAGVTQSQLAKVLGVSMQQVQKYENGTNRITSGKLLATARHLNVPITLFFEEETAAPQDASMDNSRKGKRQAAKIANSFSKIQDPAIKKQMLALIENLAK